MPHTEVNRPDLFDSYIHVMATYVSKTKHIPFNEAKQKIAQIVETQKKDKRVVYVKAVERGKTINANESLCQFLKEIQDKVVAPNGGVYYTS